MSTIISDTTHKARKPHQCDACQSRIEIGETYRRQRGVWEGDIGVWRAHVDCSAAIAHFHKLWGLASDEGVDFQWFSGADFVELRAKFPTVAARLDVKEGAANG